MTRLLKTLSLLSFVMALMLPAKAQDLSNNKFGRGVRLMASDSSFSMKFTVRIQTQYEGEKNLETKDFNDIFHVRRARIKFDGFMYDPKLEYKIELAVANRDINSGAIPESGNTSNIVLDAFVTWNFWRDWSLVFGQKKLPGNRERVVSSQQVQFVDRSNVNARFNIDRDLGVHLLYNKEKVNLTGAVTMGEGRNMVVDNIGGYDYTVRAEYLPFGQFTNGGDYFYSDLAREKTPKLSLGVTYDYNERAARQGGNLGRFFSTTRDLKTIFADAHFKYRGFSSYLEYANKKAVTGPVVYDETGDFANAYYTGEGFNAQAGYLFRNNWEVAARYTTVTPEEVTLRNKNKQYTFGLSKYFVAHFLKVQTDVSLIEEENSPDFMAYRFKVEFSL